jgi:ubiquinone/menaquinone biosynthesis C-methylase UbiE
LVKFVSARGERLPFDTASFDLTLSVNTLHHLQEPFQVMSEIVRVLTPTGKVVLSDFSAEGFELVGRIHENEGKQHPVCGVSLSDAGKFLTDRGFAVAMTNTRYQDILVARRPENVRRSEMNR